MPKGMQPIYTQKVPSGASAIIFNNIPQNYTDLKLSLSVRASSNQWDSIGIIFNGNQAARSRTILYGNGSGTFSNTSTYRDVGGAGGTNITSDTYASFDFYIPRYSDYIFHQIMVDAIAENVSSEAYQYLTAFLDLNNTPITSISVSSSTTGLAFAAESTMTLYGISK